MENVSRIFFASFNYVLSDSFPMMIAMFYLAAYVILFLYFHRKKTKRRENEREFSLLEKTLADGSLTTPTADLLQAIFCGMRKKIELDSFDKVSLSIYLFEYIKMHPEEYDKVHPLIEDIKKMDPYVDVPAEERRVIFELSQQIKSLPDMQNLLGKIDYIATLIAKREQLVERLSDKSAKYTRIGVILTTLFGIFTLIQLIMMLVPPGESTQVLVQSAMINSNKK